MRRLFLCFLLCLLPLRLWAGVWMPMAEGVVHHTETTASQSTHASHADACHNGHDAQALAGSAHEVHISHGAPDAVADTDADAVASQAVCHDGTCQLCGVCHQGVSLTVWPQWMPVFQTHPQPGLEPQPQAGMARSPLIKPPIS
jgi:hypothetical protein